LERKVLHLGSDKTIVALLLLLAACALGLESLLLLLEGVLAAGTSHCTLCLSMVGLSKYTELTGSMS
jgi:hypothetical protein